MVRFCWIVLTLLRSAVHTCGHQLVRRQSGASEIRSITSVSSINSQPCCWIYPGVAAVKINSWYTSIATQYTATVITTFIQYKDTLLTANSSTAYLATEEVFTDFSYYGCYGTPITVPGVPTTLVDAYLLNAHGEYGASTVVRSNETIITFGYTDLKIASPTPYLSFPQMRVYTTYPEDTRTPGISYLPSQAPYDPELCGTSSEISYLTWSSSAWSYKTKTEYMPLGYGFGPRDSLHYYDYEYCYDEPSEFAFAMPIPAPMPNQDVFVSLPDGISASIVANKTLLSMSPWLTNCFTMGALGEPTVHIQVMQLTSDASVTLTTNAVFAARTSATVNLPIKTEQPQAAPTPAQSPQALSTQAQQATRSEAAAGTRIVQGGIVTLGSTTAAFQLGNSAAVIAGSTISVGGAAVILNGQTLTLTAQPSGGLALVVDGSSTQALSAMPVAQQVVTLGTQALTIAAQSGAVFVNNVRVSSGSPTSVDGVAVSFDQTNIVLGDRSTTVTQGLPTTVTMLPGASVVLSGSGESTTSQGIGGAIIGGLGGGSSNTAAPYRGAGSVPAVDPSSCFAALMLALAGVAVLAL